MSQILEISTDNKYISVEDGFVIIKEDNNIIGKVVVDNLNSIIITGQKVIYSNNFLVALSENDIPLVICNKKYMPVSILFPIETAYKQAKILDSQLQAKETTKNNLWKKIVQHKLTNQARILEFLDKNYGFLYQLSKEVLSGDTTNKEGEAARGYWKELFGDNFIRDRNLEGINSLLNYGYIILRSATARYIAASGLHPTFAIHHSNQYNSFRLADDLMEVFRPLVDLKVYRLLKENNLELTPNIKRELILILHNNIGGHLGKTEILYCIRDFVISLSKFYQNERDDLEFPKILKENLKEIYERIE
jgi:CRISPR-associated protein Cas1